MFENITGSKSNALYISISPGVRRWSVCGRGSSCACSSGDPARIEPSPASALRRDMLLAHVDSIGPMVTSVHRRLSDSRLGDRGLGDRGLGDYVSQNSHRGHGVSFFLKKRSLCLRVSVLK